MSAQMACEQLEQLAKDAIDSLEVIYRGKFKKEKRILAQSTRLAISLAKNEESDTDNIRRLGEGWVGEEAWTIALYCALRHKESVADAIIASVNHDGDSDSTGAICGNIMGAIYGYEAIRNLNLFCPQGKSLDNTLELTNIIMALADDLYTGCIIGEYESIDTPEKKQWYARYCEMLPVGI